LAYEVLPGNTADKTTLKDFLAKIEDQHGKADRVWVMDRGIPSEEILGQMRASTPPVSYPRIGSGNHEMVCVQPRTMHSDCSAFHQLGDGSATSKGSTAQGWSDFQHFYSRF